MDAKRLSIIASLLRPEPSLPMSWERRAPVSGVRSDRRTGVVSIKALFWVAVSIAVGLAIGQLH